MENLMVVERIANIAVSNGIVRIECAAVNAAGQEKSSGTMLIPANLAGPVVHSLVKGMQELDKKLREAAATSSVFPATVPTGQLS
jgi:hypothetical protein